MKRVVADTNIVVSAFLRGGKPLQLIQLARAGQIELAVSDAIMAETSRVLHDKFHVPAEDVQLLSEELRAFAIRVAPTETVDAVPGDATDNRILECAVAAKSDVVVTGDWHLLSLGSYRGIRMMTPAAFLEEFQARAR